VAHLIDTNVLLRWVNPASPVYPEIIAAIASLRPVEEPLLVTPQNVIEFWNVTTRPVERNGLGYDIAAAGRAVETIERIFPLAADIPAIHEEWRRLVVACNFSEGLVHDARLAAAIRVHGIDHILTYNGADFARYPGVTRVHPLDLPAP